MNERRRRLIEVAFPLEEVSAHSRREKNQRYGHISTLHVWWARRPLAACRAFIYASLVDDPDTDEERDALLKEVADLASWDAVRKPDQVVRPRAQGGSGLTGAQLLERARLRIRDCNGGKPPRLLDPFAGGGAIPLEALRLGCEVDASDLNPVAVLILKGTVEYPQRYGRPLAEQREQLARGERDCIAGVNGEVPTYIREAAKTAQSSFAESDSVAAYERNPLAADVRYWGNWMLERARAELAEFYPPDPDGSIPVAYLWSRTVPCPNCGAEMPLIRQYWLARKDKKKIALNPVIDHASKRVDFEVVEGANVSGDPTEATTSRGDTVCLVCRQVATAEYVRQAGRDGKMGAMMTAVVLEAKGRGGKRYRPDTLVDLAAFEAAGTQLATLEAAHKRDLGLVPDEPLADDPRNIWCYQYGLDTFGKLFNARQLLTLTTFAHLVHEAYLEMRGADLEMDYATTVATYLGFVVDRLADFTSTLAVLKAAGARGITHTFARQALPMVWDYAEANPFSPRGAGWANYLDYVAAALESFPTDVSEGRVRQVDARQPRSSASVVVTDPPYYDSINYADLSDYFYVWLKRSLGDIHPELLSLPLTPKREQIVMNVYAPGGAAQDLSRRGMARRHYLEGMAGAFTAISGSLERDGLAGVVFAHTDSEAWSTLIKGLLDARLIPYGSWPIDTELENKVSRLGQARLSTSIWMVCRPGHGARADAFLGDLLAEMRPAIDDRLRYFWAHGIRGADFFISAIGPGLSVFGRHTNVLRPDGHEVTPGEFIDLVRRESTRVALEQVLQGTDLGIVDPLTQQYVTWVWSYSRAPLDAGEAIALCLATGADYGQVVRPESIAVEAREASKKVVKLRTIRERGREDEFLGLSTPARPAPLVDQLQRAAHLWSQNKMDELGTYRQELGETRWGALRVLGQAVAECLPDGDEDRRLIFGLLASNVRVPATPSATASAGPGFGSARQPLPGFEQAVSPQVPLPSPDEV